MGIWTKSDKWWSLANGLGVIAFLALASISWIEPELRGEAVATAGVAMVWGLTALPVLVAFMLADLVWLGLSISRSASWSDLRTMLPWCITLAVWVLAFVFDGLHH